MNSSKLILFGSFTEDEVKSFQNKPPENTEVPVHKPEFQFGSLPPLLGEVLSASASSCQTGKLLVKSANSGKKNDGGFLDKKGTLQGVSKENGTVVGYRNLSVQSDGVQAHRASSPCLSSLTLSKSNNNGAVLSQPLISAPLCGHDTRSKVVYSNGVHDESQTAVPTKYVGNKMSNGAIADVSGLLPRGLINAGNLCFLNATLQALLSCSPFVKLLQELRTRDIPKVDYPTLIAFVDFLSEFDLPTDSSSKKKDPNAVETGRPFSPAMFEEVVKNFTPDVPSGFSGRTRQEDAQEFLSFVMDQLHDELLKLGGQDSSMGAKKSSLVSSSDEDDEWETVGPKNKSAVTRTQSIVSSELSAIFGGELKSVVKAKGNRASATIQPYLLLHLDIFSEAVHTIEDALRLFSAPETLEGYRASNTGKAGVVSASKSIKIQTLSKIMILHLMRFSYGSQGSTKLHKPIRFPLDFVLGRDLLVSPLHEGRKYELVATITHHGKDPSKGHYTADARHTNGQWLRFDDASVVAIPTTKVLHDQAYVLFYKQV
ncbi:hypothetical protein RND81_01G151800 [Saponaria officinalis]|uniref:Ubiquitin carboxyl-terminal hydrolase n=1 Tax=Saponaria officinalis TaxID=3572 RepID=A0AAW1NA35_SAPOF